MGNKITKDMLIGHIVREHPACVEVLFNHGFHCIGCDLAADETIEQGARAHGYSEPEIDEIVKELSVAANEGAPDSMKAESSKAAGEAGAAQEECIGRGTLQEEGKAWKNVSDINAAKKGGEIKISPRFESAGFGKESGKKKKSEPG